MINFRIKDGQEDKVKFSMGGDPESIFNQSGALIIAIADLLIMYYDTKTGEDYIKDFIEVLEYYYRLKFSKEYRDN